MGFDWRPRGSAGESRIALGRGNKDREALSRAVEALSTHPGCTGRQVAEASQVSPGRTERLLGRDLWSLVLPANGWALGSEQRWTDAQVVGALREAHRLSNGWLTEAAYSALAARPDSRAPHSQTIIRHFGTWNAALRRAGLEPIPPSRTYKKRWDAETIPPAVANFIITRVTTSGSAYRAWAVGKDSFPAAATIQRVMTWDEAVLSAMDLLPTEDYLSRYSAAVAAAGEMRARALGFDLTPPTVATGS